MTLPAASSKIGMSRRSGPWSTPQVVPVARADGYRGKISSSATGDNVTSVPVQDREWSVACAHRPGTVVPGDRPHRAILPATR
jgi:hypothetical protein